MQESGDYTLTAKYGDAETDVLKTASLPITVKFTDLGAPAEPEPLEEEEEVEEEATEEAALEEETAEVEEEKEG